MIHQGEAFAIKSIRLVKDRDGIQNFNKILNEVILLKIASALKAGPHFCNIFGYDMIIFDD